MHIYVIADVSRLVTRLLLENIFMTCKYGTASNFIDGKCLQTTCVVASNNNQVNETWPPKVWSSNAAVTHTPYNDKMARTMTMRKSDLYKLSNGCNAFICIELNDSLTF